MPADTTAAAVESLRRLVASGDLRPGDRLVERPLAERLGVSRMPVREALRLLAREGLAEERATGGMAVRGLAPDDVEVLFRVRAALEDLICEQVVAHASDAALRRLDHVLDRAEAAVQRGDLADARALNAEFHVVLVELAGPVLGAVMEPVAGRMRLLLTQHEDPAPMLAAHRRIAAALRQRNAELASLCCATTWTSPRTRWLPP